MEVKEISMLFSGEMMRAIRLDIKTITRRIIKPQPVDPSDEPSFDPVALVWRWDHSNERRPQALEGDLIWCRETWIEGFPTGEPDRWSSIRPTGFEGHGRAFYRADDDDPPDEPRRNWRSSMFMPRWACRETLRVLSVRPERLQGITEEDARAEGVEPWEFGPEQCMTTGERGADSPHRGGFACLWDELHEKDGHLWLYNPWVWRYEFERVK